MSSPLFFDRVKETSTTTGTGNFTVSGVALSGGFRRFQDVLSTNDTFYYAIENPSANEWEVGLGTYTASVTIARTSVLASSNSGSAVSFSAGTKNVWIDFPAGQIIIASSTPIWSGLHTFNANITTGSGHSLAISTLNSAITVQPGPQLGAVANGAGVTIQGGNGGVSAGDGGTLSLDSGAPTGGGAASIFVGQTNALSMLIGATQTTSITIAATAVGLGRSGATTTVTGGFTQTGGTFSVTSDGTLSLYTSNAATANGIDIIAGSSTGVNIDGPSISVIAGFGGSGNSSGGTLFLDSGNAIGSGTSTVNISGTYATSTLIGRVGSTISLKGQLITTGIWTGDTVGFPLTWVSTTTILVGYQNKNAPTSICRDKADADFITLAGGTTYIISTASTGTLGVDSFTGTGKVTVNNSATLSTGNVNNNWTGDFKKRLCTGTFNTVTASTTVTATGSFFTTEFKINDLIGVDGFTHSSAFIRITAIASDTSMTVATAVSFTSGDPISCIESPTMSIAGDGASPHQVQKISADTGASSLVLTEATTGGSLTNAVITIGTIYARAAVSAAQYGFVWLGKGSSGTTAYVSTQRTTPFGVTDYNVSVKRIGSLCYTAAGNIVKFKQDGNNSRRKYNTQSRVQALTSGSATTWTALDANNAVPPTAVSLVLFLQSLAPTAVGTLWVGSNDMVTIGGTSVSEAESGIACPAAGVASVTQPCHCDNLRKFAYFRDATTGATQNIFVIGYEEDI